MRSALRLLVVALWVSGACGDSASAAVRVHDSRAESTRRHQLAGLRNQIATLQEALQVSRDQYAALTGSRGYGTAFPTGLRTRFPDAAPGVAGLLTGIAGDGLLGTLFRYLLERTGLEIAEPVPGAGSQAFHNLRVRRSQGQEALAQMAYQETANDLRIIEALSQSIEHARDPKEVLDLQARLLAQGAKSSLIAARVLAAAELNRARQAAERSRRAVTVHGLVAPRFINPQIRANGGRGE